MSAPNLFRTFSPRRDGSFLISSNKFSFVDFIFAGPLGWDL
jgi:hypothetical protein